MSWERSKGEKEWRTCCRRQGDEASPVGPDEGAHSFVDLSRLSESGQSGVDECRPEILLYEEVSRGGSSR